MTSDMPSNLAASVHQRLLNLSHAHDEELQSVLIRYASERLLYRLSQSAHAEQFVLKGATLFRLWGGGPYRATRDLDLLGYGNADAGHIEHVFRHVCRVAVEQDGLFFDDSTVRGQEIRGNEIYGGIRITLTARLAKAIIPVQVDVAFGDVVVPTPKIAVLPTILRFPAPRLKVYPREAVVSEKFQAMTVLGIANSRMKDFYDIWVLASRFAFLSRPLATSIKETFDRRSTPLPEQAPLALTAEFQQDQLKRNQWDAFLRRGQVPEERLTLADSIEMIRNLVMPPTLALVAGETFDRTWQPGGPWR